MTYKHIGIPSKRNPARIYRERLFNFGHPIPANFRVEKSRGRKRYVTPIIAFDVETSTVGECCYIADWKVSIDRYGTWQGFGIDEFLTFCDNLVKSQGLSTAKRAAIYVHNLAYEFQFIKKYFDWAEVLATKIHSELRACTVDGLEFRDTYQLVDMSLAEWARRDNSIDVSKGGYDYSKVRYRDTLKSKEELRYEVADTLIICQGLRQRLTCDTHATLPYTATGYVRRDFRDVCKGDPECDSLYKSLKFDEPQSFAMYKNAFIGGKVRLNPAYAEEVTDIYGYDIASSYPYRLVVNEYPCSPPIYINNPSDEDIEQICKGDQLYIIEYTCENVKLKTRHYPSVSISEPTRILGEFDDSGALITCESMTNCLTSLDFEEFKRNYTFEKLIVERITYHERKAILPRAMRRKILDLYKTKTELKGVGGKENEYESGKRRFNSIYGMFVTSPIRDEIEYDDDMIGHYIRKSLKDLPTISDALEKYYNATNSFLSYEIGVWTTAFARQEFYKGVYADIDHFVYGDTDSNKRETPLDWYSLRNGEIIAELEKNYTEDEYAPKDIHGVRHPIGVWELENYEPIKFKGFGSKKYVTYDGEKSKITIAGCSKKAAQYLEKNGGVLSAEIGLTIPKGESGRTSAKYIEEPRYITHNGDEYGSLSSVIITDCEYTLSNTPNHSLYVLLMKGEKHERTEKNRTY